MHATRRLPLPFSQPEAGLILERARKALANGRFDLAEEILTKPLLDMETMVGSLRIYQAELEMQNQELRASNGKLDQSLAQFTSFFSLLAIAGLSVDRNGFIREANPAAERLFDLMQRRLPQHSFLRLVSDCHRAAVVDALQTARRGEQTKLGAIRSATP